MKKAASTAKSLGAASVVFLVFLLFAVIFHFGMMYFGVFTVKVAGNSMLPTYHDGDLLVMKAYPLRFGDPKKWDVVVLRDGNGYIVIKRIVRVPGELDDISPFSRRILGPEEYVVLGDNTNNSIDSRFYGTVVKSQMIGVIE